MTTDEGFSLSLKMWDSEYIVNKPHSQVALDEVIEDFRKVLILAGYPESAVDRYIDLE